MTASRRVLLSGFAALIIAGSALSLRSSAKPPKATADANRVTNSDIGISYVIPDGYFENAELARGFGGKLAFMGPRTNQSRTLIATSNYTLNSYLVTCVVVIVQNRLKDVEFDAVAPATTAKVMLAWMNSVLGRAGALLNYQNSAMIDVNGHPALAVLAETSLPNSDDRVMLRLVFVNHRDKMFVFLFHASDTEFETRVPSFDAFMRSLKFLQPNVNPTPAPNKPINIQIGNASGTMAINRPIAG